MKKIKTKKPRFFFFFEMEKLALRVLRVTGTFGGVLGVTVTHFLEKKQDVDTVLDPPKDLGTYFLSTQNQKNK